MLHLKIMKEEMLMSRVPAILGFRPDLVGEQTVTGRECEQQDSRNIACQDENKSTARGLVSNNNDMLQPRASRYYLVISSCVGGRWQAVSPSAVVINKSLQWSGNQRPNKSTYQDKSTTQPRLRRVRMFS